jgi:hypothetical protein
MQINLSAVDVTFINMALEDKRRTLSNDLRRLSQSYDVMPNALEVAEGLLQRFLDAEKAIREQAGLPPPVEFNVTIPQRKAT